MKAEQAQYMILMGLLLLLVLSGVSFAKQSQELQNLEQAIEKIKNNLNQDPTLFNRFANTKYNLGASFSLVDKARFDGSQLINPAGGALDLGSLNKLPGLTQITMLAAGGFQFTYAPPSGRAGVPADIRVEGVSLIKATPTGLSVDRMELIPSGRLSLKKTSSGMQVQGLGTLKVNQQTFDIQSPDNPMIFNSDIAGVRSVTIPAHSGFLSSLKYKGHELRPQEGDLTLYLRKEEYTNARGNKALIDTKVSISQESGRLLLDKYYHFRNGEAGLVRRAFLGGIPPTQVSYSYKNMPMTIVGPVPIENTKGYNSIADLFSAYGYGEGSENKAARRAYYEKYIGGVYRGSARQNIELLSSIQSGNIPLFPEGEKRFDFSSQPEPVPLDIQGEIRTSTQQPVRRTSLPVVSTLRNTPLIRNTRPAYTPELSTSGSLDTVAQPPEGIEPVRGKVTYYYTPVYDTEDMTGVSETNLNTFKKKVKLEGSGIYRSESDGRWYHRNYKGKNSLLTERNQYGMTASGKTPFVGMIAAPKGIPLGSIAYVETQDGTYARFLVGDRGGAIKERQGVYQIDIWAGVGRPSIVNAERTNSISGVRISPNPRIYFVPPEA